MVEIIPKTFEEIPPWQRILLFSLFFLILAVITGSFFLNDTVDEARTYLDTLEARVLQEGIPKIKRLEEEILSYKNKIDDFYLIFDGHVSTEKLFKFLEQKTHPRVFFSQASINPKLFKVSLYGLADSFFSLGQQILIFQEESMIKEISLSETSINKEGGINFSLDIVFEEETFKYFEDLGNKE